jgi:hypothetical protein
MSTSYFAVFAIIAYVAATAALIHSLHTDYVAQGASVWQRLRFLGLGWGAGDGQAAVRVGGLSAGDGDSLRAATVGEGGRERGVRQGNRAMWTACRRSTQTGNRR